MQEEGLQLYILIISQMGAHHIAGRISKLLYRTEQVGNDLTHGYDTIRFPSVIEQKFPLF